MYAYCSNNPVMMHDPSGMGGEDDNVTTTKLRDSAILKANEIATANFDLKNYGNAAAESKSKNVQEAVFSFLTSEEGKEMFKGESATVARDFLELTVSLWNDQQLTAFNDDKVKDQYESYQRRLGDAKTDADKVAILKERHNTETLNTDRFTMSVDAAIFISTLGNIGSMIESSFNKLKNFSFSNLKNNVVQQASNKIPKGFKDANQFKQAGQELKNALAKSGIEFESIGVRGSAVTNSSSKGGGFRLDGSNKSDIDVFIVLKKDIGINSSKNIEGFIHPGKLFEKFPLLKEWSMKWTKVLNREISTGAFKPNTFKDSKNIKF